MEHPPMDQSILDCSAIQKQREDDNELGSYDGMAHNESNINSLNKDVVAYQQQQQNQQQQTQTNTNEDAQPGQQAAGGATL